MENAKKEALREKYTEKYHADERESNVTKEGLAAGGAIAIAYCVVRIIYLGLAKGRFALAELILLLLIVFVTTAIQHQNKVYDIPTYFGRRLNTGTDRKAKMSRILMYMGDAAAFAAVYLAADLIFNFTTNLTSSAVLDGIIDFFIGFVIMFLLDMLLGESKVKKYNAYQKQLEEEENNLDD